MVDLHKKIIKAQFNKQAEKFSKWARKNLDFIELFYDSCKLKTDDILLDVACGSGEFAVFCAKKIKEVHGIDISDNMIKLAENKAHINQLTNINFICTDVEKIPFEDAFFTAISCQSSFHHMRNYSTVFSEMVRCVKKYGKICIGDIMAYRNEKINNFFEDFEKKIDISHNYALSKEDFINLFESYNIKISKKLVTEVEHNFNEYLNHAVQSKKNLKKLNKLIEKGLSDFEISKFLYIKNDEIVFKRAGIIIWGIKN